ncbi:hypothetical protein V495_02903 [Pseudogymnoascus sp. VKM F-4514 (FW-929)]|nr:hypothetical protein V495_02903 [Pseudogymnoascus sp. VKM F-4514 (FW-929)]KFY53950.1 hypothetical protein V497_08099 [Pseudogymnoascus sp. VKM F-4516 (FW-969)]
MLSQVLFLIALALFSSPFTSALPSFPTVKFNQKVVAPSTNSEATTLSYRIKDSYDSSNFFNSFSFFTGSDPTHGFVKYLSQSAAAAANIISTNNAQVLLHVDHTNSAPTGRSSVRLTSQKNYNHGLFIADIAHMPGGACGSWPAFWLVGPNWPFTGEIDIIEGVNLQTTDSMTLHTSAGCVVDNQGSLPGTTTLETNCNANSGFNGCSVSTSDPRGFGTGFNAAGGGVYAMQWESSGVYIWFFPRGSVPADINSGAPKTQNWGLPVAAFNGGNGCNIDQHFKDHQIVFDTTFCGDWAGSVWGNGACASRGSCESYVANNPLAFSESYWLINSVKVYQLG